MKRSDSQDAANHVEWPSLSHQKELVELGQHQHQQRLPRGQTAVAEGGWPARSCRVPMATPSQSSAAADPTAAIMSSTSSNSASSVSSDGRKRKESPPDSTAASKRYRHHKLVSITSLSTVCTAAGSSLTHVKEAQGFHLFTGPTSSGSCVEDANDHCSRFAVGAGGYTLGPSAMFKPVRTNFPSCKPAGEASCDATAGGSITRLSTACMRLRNEGTRKQSTTESDEDVTSSVQNRGDVVGQGQEVESSILASKKRKVGESENLETLVTGCLTSDAPVRFQEEDGNNNTLTVSDDDVELASSSPDDQSASAPLFVLSSGRLSRGEGSRFLLHPNCEFPGHRNFSYLVFVLVKARQQVVLRRPC